MDDLISRQAAIDALGEGAMVNYQAAGHDNGLIKAINVIKGLPSAQSEQRWIPVSERLPEPYTEVLAFVNAGSKYCEVLNYDTPGDGTYSLQFYRTDYDGYPTIYTKNVIAWMPLPQAYKAERRNDEP